MSDYVFTGRLVPDLCDINLAVPVPLQMHAVDAGSLFQFATLKYQPQLRI